MRSSCNILSYTDTWVAWVGKQVCRVGMDSEGEVNNICAESYT